MRINSIIENPISITVLVPCYNGTQTISRCFNSILNQNYPIDFLKILCIDDGSNDNSLQIIKEFQKKFPNRINVIHQENHGVSYTRQKLLDNVSTAYFIFCDVDDYFANQAIHNLFISSNYGEADATVSKAYRLSKNGHRRVWPLNSHLKNHMTAEQYLYSNVPILWNILFKTESVNETKFKFKSGINIGEDMCMLFYMFPKFSSIGICRKKTYYFVQHDDSLTDSRNSKYKNILPTIKQLQYFLSIKKELSDTLINEYIFCSFSYIYSVLYVLRRWYRWEPPEKEFTHKIFRELYRVFDRFNVKLKSPKFWRRRIFWHFFCKRKIDRKYR